MYKLVTETPKKGIKQDTAEQREWGNQVLLKNEGHDIVLFDVDKIKRALHQEVKNELQDNEALKLR